LDCPSFESLARAAYKDSSSMPAGETSLVGRLACTVD
jgi:hypothetical protein